MSPNVVLVGVPEFVAVVVDVRPLQVELVRLRRPPFGLVRINSLHFKEVQVKRSNIPPKFVANLKKKQIFK